MGIEENKEGKPSSFTYLFMKGKKGPPGAHGAQLSWSLAKFMYIWALLGSFRIKIQQSWKARIFSQNENTWWEECLHTNRHPNFRTVFEFISLTHFISDVLSEVWLLLHGSQKKSTFIFKYGSSCFCFPIWGMLHHRRKREEIVHWLTSWFIFYIKRLICCM